MEDGRSTYEPLKVIHATEPDELDDEDDDLQLAKFNRADEGREFRQQFC